MNNEKKPTSNINARELELIDKLIQQRIAMHTIFEHTPNNELFVKRAENQMEEIHKTKKSFFNSAY